MNRKEKWETFRNNYGFLPNGEMESFENECRFLKMETKMKMETCSPIQDYLKMMKE